MQFSLTVEPQSLVKKTQQTPKPAAHVPDAAPLLSEHSEIKSISFLAVYGCNSLSLGEMEWAEERGRRGRYQN